MEIKSIGSQKPKNNWKKRARKEERQLEAKQRQAEHDRKKAPGVIKSLDGKEARNKDGV